MKFLLTKTSLLSLFFYCLSHQAASQGRVVINEIMPWSGCNTTSEFIELLNFGPGPVDIGCHIISNGRYSVTIPPHTIIQPREYFVLSGQNTLSSGCGNRDSLIHVDLNWNNCNCTNVSIPTTGDGFMQNGGGANEKIVLLDPDLNVIDAVSRNTTVSSSVSITTPVVGDCSAKTFNLGTMSIAYEVMNSSTGIDNSFARKVDGDCGWVKTTAISANAPNKTGSTASASYDFSTLSASECGGTTGSISIGVSAADVNSLFPMNYTLGFDADSNEVFNSNDQYLFGTDNSASTIDINNLIYGRYRITVASSAGCNLKSYDFYIFNCYGVVLPVKLLYFRSAGQANGQLYFHYRLSSVEDIKELGLEGSDGSNFNALFTTTGPFDHSERQLSTSFLYQKYRLRLVSKSGAVSYSPVINMAGREGSMNAWPNPANNRAFVRFFSPLKEPGRYTLCNSLGTEVLSSPIQLEGREQVISIPTKDLLPGLYYVRITSASLSGISFRLIKN